jgi:hypothetical protein
MVFVRIMIWSLFQRDQRGEHDEPLWLAARPLNRASRSPGDQADYEQDQEDHE